MLVTKKLTLETDMITVTFNHDESGPFVQSFACKSLYDTKKQGAHKQLDELVTQLREIQRALKLNQNIPQHKEY